MGTRQAGQAGASEAGFLVQAVGLGQRKGRLMTSCPGMSLRERERERKPAKPRKSDILYLYKVAEFPTLRFLREI